MKFTEVTATYEPGGGVLGGPKNMVLGSVICAAPDSDMPGAATETGCRISVVQGPKRTICVTASEPMYWSRLLGPLYRLERLLMIFDGSFVPLKDLRFAGGSDEPPSESDAAAVREQSLLQRLSYFNSADYLQGMGLKLVDFEDVLTDELFGRWQMLLDEPGIVNQLYLYAVSDNGMPVDVSLAFLVELAEPMVEILKERKSLFPELHPGKKDTTLRCCLEALIGKYGGVIFGEEIDTAYDGLLDKLRDSRVRVMHIKRDSGNYFDGGHCILYLRKLSLLYRCVVLDLLGVPSGAYDARLKEISSHLDTWAGQLPAQSTGARAVASNSNDGSGEGRLALRRHE